MIRIFALTSSLLALAACSKDEHGGHHADHAALTGGYAGAVEGQANGVDGVEASAFVTDGPHGMMIRVDVMGVGEGFHGIHLHQVGDCSDAEAGFKASGSHINPAGNAHGLMNADGFEAADLPNVYAHGSGHARAELFVPDLRLADAMDEDGFALVIHQNADDHVSQPIGGAGPRLACVAFTQ